MFASNAAGDQLRRVDSQSRLPMRFPPLPPIDPSFNLPKTLFDGYPELLTEKHNAFKIVMASFAPSRKDPLPHACKMKVGFWFPTSSNTPQYENLQVQKIIFPNLPDANGTFPIKGQFMEFDAQTNCRTHTIYVFKLDTSAKKALLKQFSSSPHASAGDTKVLLNVMLHCPTTVEEYPTTASEPNFKRESHAIYITMPRAENANVNERPPPRSLLSDVKAAKPRNELILRDLIALTNGQSKSATIPDINLHVQHIVWPSHTPPAIQTRLVGLLVNDGNGIIHDVKPDSQLVEVRDGQMSGATVTFRLDSGLAERLRSKLMIERPPALRHDGATVRQGWIGCSSITLTRSDGLYGNAVHQKKHAFLLKLPA